MIRLTVPSIEDDDLDAVRRVLATGFLVQGPNVAAFEEALRTRTGTSHAVAVSSGTSALHLALLALGVEPGDLVLVTSYSWPATANVIELCGATPTFVDIERGTCNIDVERLQQRATALMAQDATRHRLKAILPVHAFGHMADMAAVMELAGRFELPVLEDAACALGSSQHGRPAGAWGRIGAFSLHPRKAITTGEGGVVATNDDSVAWKVRTLRNHGLDAAKGVPDFVMPGFNYRMTDFQAALGMAQCAKLSRLIERRGALAANYGRLLRGSHITPLDVADGHEPVFQSYVCLLPREAASRRAWLISSLKESGIETTKGTWHIPMTTYYSTRYGFKPGDFPVTDDVDGRALSLPMYERLTESEQDYVVRTLRELVE